MILEIKMRLAIKWEAIVFNTDHDNKDDNDNLLFADKL